MASTRNKRHLLIDMPSAKELFQRDKELSGRWSGWVNGPDASRVFAIANSELLNYSDELTQDMIKGARIYRAILENLCEPDDAEVQIPKSGLVHDIDPKPRTIKRKGK